VDPASELQLFAKLKYDKADQSGAGGPGLSLSHISSPHTRSAYERGGHAAQSHWFIAAGPAAKAFCGLAQISAIAG
jgi:hypothetical protein